MSTVKEKGWSKNTKQPVKKIAPVKKTITPAPPPAAKVWNNRDFVMAVFGFLTTREMPLIFGRGAECSGIAEILGKICDANEIPTTSGKYPDLNIPAGLEHITNVEPPNQNFTVPPVEEITRHIVTQIRNYEPHAQNEIIAQVLKIALTERKEQLHKAISHSHYMEKTATELETIAPGINLKNV